MAEPRTNEDLMKEYTSMKKEWGHMKKEMASQEKRLKTSSEELESKEKYIRKLAKEKKNLAEALAAGKKDLDAAKKEAEQLSKAEIRAEEAEHERLSLLEKLREEEMRAAKLVDEKILDAEEISKKDIAAANAADQTARLSSELETLRETASILASEKARDLIVREKEAAELIESVNVVSSERDKLLVELTKKGGDVATLRERQRSLEHDLSTKELEVSELQKEKVKLLETTAKVELSDAAARQAGVEISQLTTEKKAEQRGRGAAEAEVSRLTGLVSNMEKSLESLAQKEEDTRGSHEQERGKLGDALEAATRESRHLTNRLEEQHTEFEAVKRALLSQVDESRADLERSQALNESAKVLEESREDAEREASRVRAELAKARRELEACADLQLVIEALTQTATELREDLEAEREAAHAGEGGHEEELREAVAARNEALVAASQASEKVHEVEVRASEERAELEEALVGEARAVALEAERAAEAQQELEGLQQELADLRTRVGNMEAESLHLQVPHAEEQHDPSPQKLSTTAGQDIAQYSIASPVTSAGQKKGGQLREDKVESEREASELEDMGSMVGRVWELVEDWLACSDCRHSLECLHSERSCLRFSPHFLPPSSKEAREKSTATTALLLAAFDDGRSAEFESTWAAHVPPSLLNGGYLQNNGEASSAEQEALGRLPDKEALPTSDTRPTALSVRRLLIKVHAHFALRPLRLRLRSSHWRQALPTATPSSSAELIARYPASPEEEAALQCFRSHLSDAAAGDDALSADPELLPLFALPQLPRPWLHPSLIPLLICDDAPPPPPLPANILLTQGTGTVATGKSTEGAADHGSWSPWVRSLRLELASLLARHLLLARPPALLVLHRAYSRWQSSAHSKWEQEVRRSNSLSRVGGHLIALAANLILNLEKGAEEGSTTRALPASSPPNIMVQQYRRQLNSLRRSWQDGTDSVGGESGRGDNKERTGVVAPPLDISRISEHLSQSVRQEHGANANRRKLGPVRDAGKCELLLRALGDRLACGSKRVREDTADALTSGDVFCILVAEDSPSSSSVIGLLGPVMLGSLGSSASSLTVRLLALLSLQPSGRHYLCASPSDGGTALAASLARTLDADQLPAPLPSSPGSPPSAYLQGGSALGSACCACVALANLVRLNKSLFAAGVVLPPLLAMMRGAFLPALRGKRGAPSPAAVSAPGGAVSVLVGPAAALLLTCCKRRQRWGANEEEEMGRVVGDMAHLYADLTRAASTREQDDTPSSGSGGESFELTLLYALLGATFCLVKAKPSLAREWQRSVKSLSAHTALNADLTWQEQCIAECESSKDGQQALDVEDVEDLSEKEREVDDASAESEELTTLTAISSLFITPPPVTDKSDEISFEEALGLNNEYGLRAFYLAGDVEKHGNISP